MSASGHLVVDDDVIHYVKMTKIDTSVVQCNVTNLHGYIYANIALTVIGQYFLSFYAILAQFNCFL